MRWLIATTCVACVCGVIAVPHAPDWAAFTRADKIEARLDPYANAPPLPSFPGTSIVAKNVPAREPDAASSYAAATPVEAMNVLDADGAEKPADVPLPPKRVTDEEVCEALTAAAQSNGLPVPFFIRLIWQESHFNSQAVSPVGAQGMAQFMPNTAVEYGLSDPFNPLEALRASARMLRGLFQQFGNLGLAAAAYNAGAGRIQEWLTSKRGKLPDETRHYVLNITGRAPEHWKTASASHDDFRVPKSAPCRPEDAVMVASLYVPDPGPPKPVAKKAETKAGKTADAKPHGKHFVAQSKEKKTKSAVAATTKSLGPVKSIAAAEPHTAKAHHGNAKESKAREGKSEGKAKAAKPSVTASLKPAKSTTASKGKAKVIGTKTASAN